MASGRSFPVCTHHFQQPKLTESLLPPWGPNSAQLSSTNAAMLAGTVTDPVIEKQWWKPALEKGLIVLLSRDACGSSIAGKLDRTLSLCLIACRLHPVYCSISEEKTGTFWEAAREPLNMIVGDAICGRIGTQGLIPLLKLKMYCCHFQNLSHFSSNYLFKLLDFFASDLFSYMSILL